MAINIKFTIKIIIFCILFCCNNPKFELKNKFNSDHTSTVFLLKNNKKIDSLVINSYYGKDSIINLKNNKWNYIYSDRCGSGCSSTKQIIFSVVNNKLKKNLHLEANYRESVLGDKTFKKNFIRELKIIKFNDNKSVEIKKTCFKNNIEFYSKTVKLIFDQEKEIYYNKKFIYGGNMQYGVKIDTTEYIYYNHKWYEFDNIQYKLRLEL